MTIYYTLISVGHIFVIKELLPGHCLQSASNTSGQREVPGAGGGSALLLLGCRARALPHPTPNPSRVPGSGPELGGFFTKVDPW